MQRRQLVRWLRNYGARRVRHGGEHDIWRGPNGQQSTLPRHREINTNTGRAVCEQLGVPRTSRRPLSGSRVVTAQRGTGSTMRRRVSPTSTSWPPQRYSSHAAAPRR